MVSVWGGLFNVTIRVRCLTRYLENMYILQKHRALWPCISDVPRPQRVNLVLSHIDALSAVMGPRQLVSLPDAE